MKIAICGSIAFAKEMIQIKKELQNHEILIPENTEKYAEGTIKVENKQEKIELNIIKKYYEEIKKS